MAHEAASVAGRNRSAGRTRRFARGALLAGAIVLAGVGIYGWGERKELAAGLIADALAQRGLQASYTITAISPRRQVLRDIVVGDPAAPDLTIEQVEIRLTPRFGLPAITDVRLVRPRLFATLRDGQVSFGSLDRFVFDGEPGPFEFPDLRLAVVDGRALVESDLGRIGARLAGSGHLRGGFSGELALSVPNLALGGCEVQGATLYGTVAIDAERPEFSGPLRFAALDCAGQALALAEGAVQLSVRADRNLADLAGQAQLDLSGLQLAGNRAQNLGGTARFAWRSAALTADYDLAASHLDAAAFTVARAKLQGQLRSSQGFERVEAEGDLAGQGVSLSTAGEGALSDASGAIAGTLLEPLLGRLRQNLTAELVQSTMEASFVARRTGNDLSLVIPQASVEGGSGASLLALSQVQLGLPGAGPAAGLPRFEGNFTTGGQGLPRVSGRMEQAPGRALEMRLQMPEYAAESARLALPDLRLVQRRDGSLVLSGQVRASGPLPGGSVAGLVLPLDASVAASGLVSLWNGCRDVRFDALQLAGLTLGNETLSLCPPAGRPILRYGADGLDLATAIGGLDLRGDLNGTPLALRSGRVELAYASAPDASGSFALADLDIALGGPEDPARFTLAGVAGRLDAEGPAGTFRGADVLLAGLPLDIRRGAGAWRLVDGKLELANADFVLEDRAPVSRFNPLAGRKASLMLDDGLITANATLIHEPSGAEVVQVNLAHELATATGHADLNLPALTFGAGLQPVDLSVLALGVVANVAGTVTGAGRIDWNEDAITSSGTFASEALDLAAAFGPVKGASGTIEFIDLLGLTTAPDQHVRIAAVNPGIEIYDGEISFSLVDGEQLRLYGGIWPFLGGTLELNPVLINIGEAEVRRYDVVIQGLNAARFIERMELNNLAASGTFDGYIPIIFDEMGNGRLEGGVLVARPGGGHLSYIGQLSYEDLGTMANLAFSSLRDVKFDNAVIGMNGPLTGELVTNVRFDGIGQGETASRNLLTRQIAKLPIRLVLNIKAPFYQLISSTRALYDPSAVRDPRGLGLLTDDGTRLRLVVDQETVDRLDEEAAIEAEERQRQSLSGQPSIQPPESEAAP